MKRLIKKLFRVFVEKPERLIGFPKDGNFWSAISPIDSLAPYSSESITLAKAILQLGIQSFDRDLAELRARVQSPEDKKIIGSDFGEHYRFLEELSFFLKPELTIEIGTHKGIGTLALSKHSTKVVTFDIKPWYEFHDTLLLKDDFKSISQVISDISIPAEWKKHAKLFAHADLVFVDGPKNGEFESTVIPLLLGQMKSDSCLVIDDIRFLNMIGIWKGIKMPKFDATSVGHFSGTGVVKIVSKSL
jgi:predicted O-methyltransferase YrrM